MPAKYNGVCAVCVAPVYQGEKIQWHPAYGAACMHCNLVEFIVDEQTKERSR